MSRFSGVQQAPPIEVFALTKAFTDDKFANKVSLGVGGKDFLFYKFGYVLYFIKLLYIKELDNFVHYNLMYVP